MTLVKEHGGRLGVAPTCEAIGLSRATYYRNKSGVRRDKAVRTSPARKLSEAERQKVLDVLHEPRFVDWAPPQVEAVSRS